MLGKFATILGPVLMGVVGLIARRALMPPFPTPEQIVNVGQLASRWGIASISLLFIIGGILFFFVDEEKGRIEAATHLNPIS
jgi:UMF1 family MFS transporter